MAEVEKAPADHYNASSTNSSILITHRTDSSKITVGFEKLVKAFKPRLVSPSEHLAAGSPKLSVPDSVEKKCNVQERELEGIHLYDLTHKEGHGHGHDSSEAENEKTHHPDATNGKAQHIYYFCGGGWQSPPSPHHWKVMALLSSQLPPSAIVTVVSYPLGPNSPAPVAFPQLLKLYDTILRLSSERNELPIFAGDSAGANIILTLTIEALRENPKRLRPYSLMAICPSVQLDRETPNPQIEEVAKHDPILTLDFINGTAAGWAGDWNKNDPRLSPLQADISILQRAGILVDGVTGGYDILAPDAVLFRNKLAEHGVRGEWLQWERQMHCWPLATTYGVFPESKEAWGWIVEVLRRRGREE